MRRDKFKGNVFVANLPIGFSDEELAQLFDGFGLVLAAYLPRDPETGKTKGHGLVNVAPERAAKEAIAALNGTVVGGRKIEVKAADPQMAISLPKPDRAPRRRPVMSTPANPDPAGAPLAPSSPPRKVIVEYKRRPFSSR
ncbi:MAG: RNA-binding protein [Alphaproteobacteria bacterium]|nr:RNA-binding protein [Alphaproteobacteria bacterium]